MLDVTKIELEFDRKSETYMHMIDTFNEFFFSHPEMKAYKREIYGTLYSDYMVSFRQIDDHYEGYYRYNHKTIFYLEMRENFLDLRIYINALEGLMRPDIAFTLEMLHVLYENSQLSCHVYTGKQLATGVPLSVSVLSKESETIAI